MGTGYLIVKVSTAQEIIPIAGATVEIFSLVGEMLNKMTTGIDGLIRPIALEAPDAANSLIPDSTEPVFSMVDVRIIADGFDESLLYGVHIMDTDTSILLVNLTPQDPSSIANYVNEITIPPTAVNLSVQRIQETQQTNSRILKEVIIPDSVTVHLGVPNSSAFNVQVQFVDYIKNVASHEIYSTWPEASLEANILCEITYVLNRIYTEWYPSRGYPFDITSSTVYDQSYVHGGEIFKYISEVVDRVFDKYVRREGRTAPYFTLYCNGTTSTCAGLSQWGTVELAQDGMNALDILHDYYPEDTEIAESNIFQDIEEAYPGYVLGEGASGQPVKIVQNYLNRIRINYPNIPQISNPDGIFNFQTTAAVRIFKHDFNLGEDGKVDKITWYKLSQVCENIKKLSDLTIEGESVGIGDAPPNVSLVEGSRGGYVTQLQFLLNYISMFYSGIPQIIENALFDARTKACVMTYQRIFALMQDGIVGPVTWNSLYEIYYNIIDNIAIPYEPEDIPPSGAYPYPGYILRLGSTGEHVEILQRVINAVGEFYPQIPKINVDGRFGAGTRTALATFQNIFGLTPDGLAGPSTWAELMNQYELLNAGTQRPTYSGYLLRVGSRGNTVMMIQGYLNSLSTQYPSIPKISTDGIFGSSTYDAVREFQRIKGLTVDGIVGQGTWNAIMDAYYGNRDGRISGSDVNPDGDENIAPTDYNPSESEQDIGNAMYEPNTAPYDAGTDNFTQQDTQNAIDQGQSNNVSANVPSANGVSGLNGSNSYTGETDYPVVNESGSYTGVNAATAYDGRNGTYTGVNGATAYNGGNGTYTGDATANNGSIFPGHNGAGIYTGGNGTCANCRPNRIDYSGANGTTGYSTAQTSLSPALPYSATAALPEPAYRPNQYPVVSETSLYQSGYQTPNVTYPSSGYQESGMAYPATQTGANIGFSLAENPAKSILYLILLRLLSLRCRCC
ncbi:MAG: peptidoglycan-binding protein [Clostridiales bacterium]|nr:peptidoglycan-binding protein [Clostridiales bacterium]